MAPQPFSLNDIILKHCRERLYVKPQKWTARHLKLLKCRFVEKPKLKFGSSTSGCPAPPDEIKRSEELCEEISAAFKYLTEVSQRRAALGSDRERALKHKHRFLRILIEESSNSCLVKPYKDYLRFYYGGKVVTRVSCRVFSYIVGDIKIPFLTSMDQKEIKDMHLALALATRSYFKSPEATLARMNFKYSKTDPYIVSILIAMAQARYHATVKNPRALKFPYEVHFLVTNFSGSGSFLLYTAKVNAAFLRKFEEPSFFSDGSLVVNYRRIAVPGIHRLVSKISRVPSGLAPPNPRKHQCPFTSATEEGLRKRRKLSEDVFMARGEDPKRWSA